MVRLQSDVPFFCFTDNTDGLNKNIETIDMDVTEYQDWYRWWPAWCKILMFNHLHEFDRKIFFDLDVIIHDDITKLLLHDAKSPRNNFSLIQSVWRGRTYQMANPTKSLFNSSCMVWKNNKKRRCESNGCNLENYQKTRKMLQNRICKITKSIKFGEISAKSTISHLTLWRRAP